MVCPANLDTNSVIMGSRLKNNPHSGDGACPGYGLAIGATVSPFVCVLVWICFPVAYPISKLLDYLLGQGHIALFRRAELKTLVNLHAGKGGELTHDETTYLLEHLTFMKKTAIDAMTPISETFTIDINAKLDRELMSLVVEKRA